MSWARILDMICAECGAECARKVEEQARLEIGGKRVTISATKTVTPLMVEEIAPGKPRRAAQDLGVHPSTAYRKLRQRLIR